MARRKRSAVVSSEDSGAGTCGIVKNAAFRAVPNDNASKTISKIAIGDTPYQLKDSVARTDLSEHKVAEDPHPVYANAEATRRALLQVNTELDKRANAYSAVVAPESATLDYNGEGPNQLDKQGTNWHSNRLLIYFKDFQPGASVVEVWDDDPRYGKLGELTKTGDNIYTGHPTGSALWVFTYCPAVTSYDSTKADKAVKDGDGNVISDTYAKVSAVPTLAAPSETATDNQAAKAKATYDFVNSSINAIAAFYITKNAQKEAFATKAQLFAATVFFNSGVQRIPTRNDYAIVLADETHGGACTRWSFQGVWGSGGGWEYQYTVNETAMTQAQLDAINSGITDSRVAIYDDCADKIDKKANKSDIPSLVGQTFDLAVDTQFKKMCVAVARVLGATVLNGDSVDDNTTGQDVVTMYGITPTDSTTFGNVQTKAGLNDSDTPGDL